MSNQESSSSQRGKGGAHSKCTTELIKDIYDLIVKGFRNTDICKNLGISETQFYAWQRPHDPSYNPQLSQTVSLAREILRENRLNNMEASLYQIATGYNVDESKTEVATNTKTKQVYVKNKITFHKHFPPNVNALMFALTNIDPEHWKQRRTSEITGKDGKDLIQKEINLDELTDEQKQAILSLGENVLRNREKDLEK